MKRTFALYGAFLLVIGFASMATAFGTGDDRMALNPFKFETITKRLLHYIYMKSRTMLKDCKLNPKTQPDIFTCLKRKYDENKDVRSSDPKKAFIAMMKLMNVSAECFSSVSDSEGKCLFKSKDEMVTVVNKDAEFFGKVIDILLKTCNATSAIESCVDNKKTKLLQLTKTMLNDPSIAEEIWNTGSSLKTCLKSEPEVEKCVLDKNMNPPWKGSPGKNLRHHFEEKVKKVLEDCDVTPENSPNVYTCMKEKPDNIGNIFSPNTKDMFINGMKLMHSFIACLQNVSWEQENCLTVKKNESLKMIEEKMKKYQVMMDQILADCGVSDTKTPALTNCVKPKSAELKKLLPTLFDDVNAAEKAWNLIEDMKKCFESEPEIMKCIKEKKSSMYSKQNWKGNSKFKMYAKIGAIFRKCNVSKESLNVDHSCLSTAMNKLRSLMLKKFSDPSAKMNEFEQLRKEAFNCFQNADEKTKTCLKEEGKALFQQSQKGKKFDTEAMKKKMDVMFNGCGISKEKTPELKLCLDKINDIVYTQIKPWLPMTEETRQKLKELGKKYWQCFEDKHEEEKKCLTSIIDRFKKLGKSRGNMTSSYLQDFANSIKTKVLGCSQNECFRKEVEKIAKLFKAYSKEVQKNGNHSEMEKEIRLNAVKALFCIQTEEETPQKKKTMTCLDGIRRDAFTKMKVFMKLFDKFGGGGIVRKKRDVDDDNEKDDDDDDDDDDEDDSDDPFLAIMEQGEIIDNQRNSVTMFRLFFNEQSMNRIQGLIDLMNAFILKCADWVPPPEAMRSRPRNDDIPKARKIVDHGGLSRRIIDHGALPARPPSDLFEKPEPVPKLDADFMQCQNMYDDINAFIDTGNGYNKYLKKRDEDEHHKHHVSTAVIVAACTGGVIAGILIQLLIVVACVMKRRCNKNTTCPLRSLPTAPPTSVPSVYSNFPSKELSIGGMPPSYSETDDREKVHPSVAAYSQILHSSTKEGAEKSC